MKRIVVSDKNPLIKRGQELNPCQEVLIILLQNLVILILKKRQSNFFHYLVILEQNFRASFEHININKCWGSIAPSNKDIFL